MKINIETILKMLPHDYPFLFVDKVIDYKHNTLTACKNISFNESYFQGHFPEKPTFPGVLLIECAAQASAIMYILDELLPQDNKCELSEEMLHNLIDDNLKNKVGYLASVKSVKFLKVVRPGDILTIYVKNKLSSDLISEIEFKITSHDEKVCTGRMTVTKNVD
ncbi:3-hydroxyacyl-ACP dehydratase FabZ [Staphylococcus pasteuri]|uniref:3-hydroxyacyl-ACP dehydratase FabZ n=1 Tax=Staphylococcus pasteuri TaxID=45972 RepID=UPI003D04548D